jgi:nucleotide-binding universal stress UspA family protein
MTRILVAFDGSEPALRAVRHVAELAKLLKSVDALLLYVERSIPMRDRLFNGRPSEVHRLEAPYLSIRALP